MPHPLILEKEGRVGNLRRNGDAVTDVSATFSKSVPDLLFSKLPGRHGKTGIAQLAQKAASEPAVDPLHGREQAMTEEWFHSIADALPGCIRLQRAVFKV